MEVIPAIDIRQGACVQLIGGDENREILRLDDPIAPLENFIDDGAGRIHIVDLDRAFGTGNNLKLIKAMLDVAGNTQLQVGGGLRELKDIDELLEAGASKIILGTKAIKEPEWLSEVSQQFKDQIIVAIDARDEDVVVDGWKTSAGQTIFDAARLAQDNGAFGVLYTDVNREGMLQGPNTSKCSQLAEFKDIEVLVGGGIASNEHIEQLAGVGVDGAIIGTAAYTGAITLRGLFD